MPRSEVRDQRCAAARGDLLGVWATARVHRWRAGSSDPSIGPLAVEALKATLAKAESEKNPTRAAAWASVPWQIEIARTWIGGEPRYPEDSGAEPLLEKLEALRER